MKPIHTFVVLANEHEARFLENSGVGKGLNELSAMRLQAETRYADAPGRSQAAAGQARHGLDRSETEREQDRHAFATQVIAATEAQWAQGAYDRLVLSAPPKMLGVLRPMLKGAAGAALLADMDKDLLQETVRDLVGHFEDIVVF